MVVVVCIGFALMNCGRQSTPAGTTQSVLKLSDDEMDDIAEVVLRYQFGFLKRVPGESDHVG
jgi:hypothetical protein